MSKLVVFDVDGTILDSLAHLDRIAEEYSRGKGLPMPDTSAIRHGYGSPRNHDFGWGVEREEQVRHLSGVFELMDSRSVSGLAHETPLLYDGVHETLVHLKDLGHTLAIVTSKSEDPLLHLLDHHKARNMFSAYRTYNDIDRRGEKEKPAPDMLQSVMRELKFAADETAMVGDTTMDILMGRAAGTGTIGVAWGAHPKEHLEKAGAHHIVDTHFNDIVLTVKKIFS